MTGSFGSKGEPAEDIPYRAAVKSNASREEVLELMRYTVSVAEIHNTLRRGRPVILDEYRVLEVRSAE